MDIDIEMGWENGARVPLHRDAVPMDALDDAPAAGSRSRGPLLWPSAEEPVLELSALSAEEAGRVASWARLETMAVIAGAGLEPVWIAARIIEASLLSGAMASGSTWPGRKLSQALMGGYAGSLPMVGTMLYGKRCKARVAAAQSRIRGVCARHDWSPERREMADLMAEGEDGSREALESVAVARLARGRLLRWLMAEESASAAVQRWWAMAWTAHRSVIGPLSGEDIGQICGFGRATVHEWVVRYLGDPSRMVTGVKIEVAGMKPDSATASYAANAARLCPRRRTRGAAGLDGAASSRLATANEAQLAARLTQQRAGWEARETARLAREMEEMVARTRRRRG